MVCCYQDINKTVYKNMWVLVVEAGLALALFIFIIWWTVPKKKKDKDKP